MHPVSCFFVQTIIKRDKIRSMGRGDKRSRKGKIFKGSFGKTRPSKISAKKTVKAEKK